MQYSFEHQIVFWTPHHCVTSCAAIPVSLQTGLGHAVLSKIMWGFLCCLAGLVWHWLWWIACCKEETYRKKVLAWYEAGLYPRVFPLPEIDSWRCASFSSGFWRNSLSQLFCLFVPKEGYWAFFFLKGCIYWTLEEEMSLQCFCV